MPAERLHHFGVAVTWVQEIRGGTIEPNEHEPERIPIERAVARSPLQGDDSQL